MEIQCRLSVNKTGLLHSLYNWSKWRLVTVWEYPKTPQILVKRTLVKNLHCCLWAESVNWNLVWTHLLRWDIEFCRVQAKKSLLVNYSFKVNDSPGGLKHCITLVFQIFTHQTWKPWNHFSCHFSKAKTTNPRTANQSLEFALVDYNSNWVMFLEGRGREREYMFWFHKNWPLVSDTQMLGRGHVHGACCIAVRANTQSEECGKHNTEAHKP